MKNKIKIISGVIFSLITLIIICLLCISLFGKKNNFDEQKVLEDYPHQVILGNGDNEKIVINFTSPEYNEINLDETNIENKSYYYIYAKINSSHTLYSDELMTKRITNDVTYKIYFSYVNDISGYVNQPLVTSGYITHLSFYMDINNNKKYDSNDFYINDYLGYEGDLEKGIYNSNSGDLWSFNQWYLFK